MSDDTPTISNHGFDTGSGGCSSPVSLIRLPIGSCHGKNFAAKVWLTIATLRLPAMSASVKNLPFINRAPTVAKNGGSQKAICPLHFSECVVPAASKSVLNPPKGGKSSAPEALTTPG